MKTVTIVGAGVIGACSALALAEQGYRVNVVEAADQLGVGASGANGAQLSYSYTDSLASPSTLRSLPKMLLGMDLSFRLSPQLNKEFLSWGLEFLANCSSRQSDQNTLAVLRLALESQKTMQLWNDRYQFSFKQQKNQKLHLYENVQELEGMRRRVDLKNQHGAEQQIIGRQAVYELEPNLEKARLNIIGAIHSPDEDVGDVIDFVSQSIAKALEVGGGSLFLSTEVTGVVEESGCAKLLKTNRMDIESDIVIICTGYQSNQVLKSLGVTCDPVIPVAGYSLTYPQTQHTPRISLTDVSRKTVLCNLGDKLRVAGMADVGRSPKTPPRKRIAKLAEAVIERFPLAGDYTVEPTTWVGVRPMTASSKPIIEQTRLKNVFVNTGHGMLGWTLAAGSAMQVKELVEQNR